MIVAVHQPQYLPWLGYFDKIIKSDCFIFLDKVQYKHREFQNRNRIRTDKGWLWLSVPVICKGRREQLLSEVKIDNTKHWQKKHWITLSFYYQKAPFFKDYASFFESLYLRKQWDRLIELNYYIIEYFLNLWEIKRKLHWESELNIDTKGTERIIQICKKLGATTYLSGRGAKAYLVESRFEEEGITLKYQEFKHPIYKQCFCEKEGDFIPNLSAIDLLFNEGARSKEIILGRERR